MRKLSVKIISFAAFFGFTDFSVAKMPFVQGGNRTRGKICLILQNKPPTFFILFTNLLGSIRAIVNEK